MRPPTSKDWAQKLGLQRFIEPEARLPLVACGYLVAHVDPRLSYHYTSMPLVTITQLNAIDDEAPNDDEAAFVAPLPWRPV
jgi:hypothetical protein